MRSLSTSSLGGLSFQSLVNRLWKLGGALVFYRSHAVQNAQFWEPAMFLRGVIAPISVWELLLLFSLMKSAQSRWLIPNIMTESPNGSSRWLNRVIFQKKLNSLVFLGILLKKWKCPLKLLASKIETPGNLLFRGFIILKTYNGKSSANAPAPEKINEREIAKINI